MIDFGNIETVISAYLDAKINNPKVDVRPLPEVESEFEKVFGKEVIIVAFSDEEPMPDIKSLGMVTQEVDITFAFLIQSKSLRGASDKLGVYALHRAIKKYIVGYEPVPGLAFRYAGFKMQEKADDIFHYAVYFKTKSISMQETDFDNTPPVLLQNITLNQNIT